MPFRRFPLVASLLWLSLALAGCGNFGFPGVYKIDVEQGNIVTPEMVEQLKPGMTRRQVRFVMGTPLIEDTFNENRWDYRYLNRNGANTLAESQLTVIFEGDALIRVEGPDAPDWGATDPDKKSGEDEVESDEA